MLNIALKLKQLATSVLPDKKLSEIKKVLAVIQQITNKNAVAAGGSVTDAILSKRWEIDYKARDIDVFVPVNHDNISSYTEAVRQEGFILAEKMNSGMTRYDDYSAAMDDVNMEVYKGSVGSYPVDVVFVYCNDIKEYVMAKFDLNIKLAIFDGRKVITSTAFKEALLSRTASVNHLHSPLSSFFRVIDATERYNLQTDETFEWLADYAAAIRKREGSEFKNMVRVKYRHLLPKVEKILEDRKPDGVKVMAIDLIRAWSNDVEMSKQASVAMKNIIGKNIIPSKPLLALGKIKNVPVKVKAENADYEDFIKIGKAGVGEWDEKQKIFIENPTSTVAMGMTAEEITTLLSNITEDEYIKGKCTVKGRVVRIGKLLNSLISYIKKLHQNIDEHNLTGAQAIAVAVEKRELSDIEKFAHLFEIRLTEGSDCYLNISSDPLDLLTVSINKQWNSCQGWCLEEPTIHNRHLLANLNGRTLVAFLHKDGKWLARCILRIALDNQTVLYETVYSANSEYDNQFIKLLKQTINEVGFNVDNGCNTELEVGPFDLPPYNQCYNSRTKENNQYKFKNIKPKRYKNTSDEIPW